MTEELSLKIQPEILKSIEQMKEFEGWNETYNFKELEWDKHSSKVAECYVFKAPDKELGGGPIIFKVDIEKNELEIGKDRLESRNESWYTEYTKIKSAPFEVELENSKDENAKEEVLKIEEETIEIER